MFEASFLSMFSVGVKLSGLDDFVTPSQNCIKPVINQTQKSENERSSGKRGVIKVEADGSYKEMYGSGDEIVLKKANITLNDCLACSGCVTTAETILIEQQSHVKLEESLKEGHWKAIVASICPQSISSLAAFYELSFSETAERVSGCLKSLGVTYVLDTNVGRNLTLIQCGKEFVDRRRNNVDNLPVFTSSCPGWICYAEKTHGEFILPYLSSVKSPQQMMGILVKRFLARKLGIDPADVFHFTVMPCYDKKLEATRSDFVTPGTEIRDVDTVIATNELNLLMDQLGTTFRDFNQMPFDDLVSICTYGENKPYTFNSHLGSGSGGYIEFVFKYAAKELFNIEDPEMNFVTKRNPDHQELFLTVDGETKLRFAVANGFRNLGNFAMKLKKKNLKYDYVEIMACPSGCLNGGGQLRIENDPKNTFLTKVKEKYFSLKAVVPSDEWFREGFEHEDEETIDSLFIATYNNVPKLDINSLNIQW